MTKTIEERTPSELKFIKKPYCLGVKTLLKIEHKKRIEREARYRSRKI